MRPLLSWKTRLNLQNITKPFRRKTIVVLPTPLQEVHWRLCHWSALVHHDEKTAKQRPKKPCEKAYLLQQVFASQFVTDNYVHPSAAASRTRSCFANITFTPEMVNRTTRRIRITRREGPYGVPQDFVTRCCVLWLNSSAGYLFQASFSTGYIPQIWFSAIIITSNEKGDLADPNNIYRPIALASVF